MNKQAIIDHLNECLKHEWTELCNIRKPASSLKECGEKFTQKNSKVMQKNPQACSAGW